MEILYDVVCGLDVHKKTVVGCIRRLVGKRVRREVRSFGTMTADLLALADWMAQARVTHVAMESTGVYWKPIYNLLEGQFEVLLVNARHLKQVPGRKTDVADCEWIAQLLQCGLLRGSFIPPPPIRQLRDLTRHRAKLVQQTVSVANRIHKVLEDANIKLASVASDILGVSGRRMLREIIQGTDDPRALAQLALKGLRKKIPQLELALEGRVEDHHRFLLRTLFEQLEFLERQIDQVSDRIEELTRPFRPQLELITTTPGIQQRIAECLLAELGADMSVFPTEKHLASWAGVCPGNHESAGKRKSGRTPKANAWLRRSLTEAAWAAAHTKDTYLSAQYRRLVPRRGNKRAVVAVAHSILISVYFMLRDRIPYHDLGSDYFLRRNAQSLSRYYCRKLEALGHRVTLEPKEDAA